MPKSQASKNSNKSAKYALLSVYDKTGIVEFAQTLVKHGYQLISTGGTAKILADAHVPLIPIHLVTGNPESFDGRMKTISFQIESGILYDRSNKKHVNEAKTLKIKPIDIVVCNLYPFEQTVSKKGVSEQEVIENIDVGGPTMIRAAAKNHANVIVVTDPSDYSKVSEALEKEAISLDFKKALAGKAFAHLSFYDAQIAKYLSDNKLPQESTIAGRFSFGLRYGDNPHQVPAAVYIEPNTASPLAKLKQHIGRGLSATNVTDIAAGLEVVRMFKEPAAVVIKHNNPCGIALGASAKQAIMRAIEADPLSAFGGVMVINQPIDETAARLFSDFKKRGVQMDIVAAVDITSSAKDMIHGVRSTTGIYTFGKIPTHRLQDMNLKFFDGGWVAQPWDDITDKDYKKWSVVTRKKPTVKQLSQMRIAWKFITRIKSNSVIVVDSSLPMTRGIGSGQTARIFSAEIALKHAGEKAKGAILASDSFFPFDDCVRLAAKYNIGAIVQQGGSIGDKSSIEAANRADIPMVFTGRRAFWH